MRHTVNAHRLAGLLDGWRAGDGSIPDRLAASVAALVLDGRLPARCHLPSERELARELGVSRSTVTATYDRLRDDGLLGSRRGSGSWVQRPPGVRNRVGPLVPAASEDGLLDLAVAAPADLPQPVVEAFAAAAAALAASPASVGDREGPGGVVGHGYHPAGLPALRGAVAARYTARGVPTTPEQILVTSGAQAAIHLLVQLLDARDVVLIEQPTYPNAIDALRRSRVRLVPIPVDADCWDTDHLLDTFDQVRPRLAYLLPDFHNPTGALLPASERGRLVEAARRAGSTLVIDETHAELALDDQPLPPPVAAHDTDGRVITIGSMSKTYWGGLRVGWIRTSSRLVARLALERSSVDLAGPVLEHLAAAHLLELADDFLPHRRTELAARRDALLGLLSERLPGWRARRPDGGLSLWVRLDQPVSTALAEAAERHRVRLAAGPRFGLDGALEQYLRLPYTLPVTHLEQAVHRLAAARADVDTRSPRVATAPPVA